MAAAMENLLPLSGTREGTARDPRVALPASTHEVEQEKAKHGVLVIAASRLLRDLLCERLGDNPEFRLVGSEPVAGPRALEIVSSAGAVIVLFWISELSIPKQLLDQIETFRSVSSQFRLVLIGMPAEERIFLAAVRAGVAGYVLDEAPIDEVLAALQLVARGGVACPSQLLPALFQWAAGQPEGAWLPGGYNRCGLSRRERQLIPLIAQGMTNKEIATELCLSEQTVKNHLHRMMRKAGAGDRFAVVERCQIASAAGM